jgi:general secretion pathway protein G
MLRRLRTQRSLRRGGFTLMEVLLVVAILLILGSIVVVSFSGIMGGAEEDTTRAQLDQVAEAVKLYKFQCRVPPTQLYDLVVAPAGLETKWRGPYLPEIPKDAWGQEITLDTSAGDGTFTVSSPGSPEKKQPIVVTERY